MGLIIHYEFSLPSKKLEDARQAIAFLHEIALDLSLMKVEPIILFSQRVILTIISLLKMEK